MPSAQFPTDQLPDKSFGLNQIGHRAEAEPDPCATAYTHRSAASAMENRVLCSRQPLLFRVVGFDLSPLSFQRPVEWRVMASYALDELLSDCLFSAPNP